MSGHFVTPSILRQPHRWKGIFLISLGLVALASWGVLGTRVISALNPSLVKEMVVASHPALDVWISYPEVASNAEPMIISTPAGVLFEHDTLVVPQGSVLSAHLGEQDGDTPELIVDGKSQAFTLDDHGDFAATEALTEGKKISIRRGWATLASWKMKIVADDPPKVLVEEPFKVTDAKTLRFSYTANDELGVSKVALRVTPVDAIPGGNNKSFDIPLPLPTMKQLAHIELGDLLSHPWSGRKVSLQIIATNETGKVGESESTSVTLPEKAFYNPVSRLLIEERNKLLQHPDDEALREEVANMMAGIAFTPSNYKNDPVILMALRSGAVRLILGNDAPAVVAVNDLLWQAAERIDAGSTNIAERMMMRTEPQSLTKDP